MSYLSREVEPMSKMLIVDDEEKIRAVVREYAEFEEFEVTEARDGMEAVALCRENDYDIIIMDVMMPRLDGYSACKEIRKQKDVPIIMLSARGEEYDKLFGFETVIDDYVVKPDGEKANLTPKEYDLLFYLVKNKGLALSRDKLLEEVWGYDFFGDDRTVDTHIKMLRGNLGPYRSDIVTLRGMGYKFDPENDASPASSR